MGCLLRRPPQQRGDQRNQVTYRDDVDSATWLVVLLRKCGYRAVSVAHRHCTGAANSTSFIGFGEITAGSLGWELALVRAQSNTSTSSHTDREQLCVCAECREAVEAAGQ